MLKKTIMASTVLAATFWVGCIMGASADICGKLVKLQQKQADQCAHISGNMTTVGTPLYKCYHNTPLSKKIDSMVFQIRKNRIKCPV